MSKPDNERKLERAARLIERAQLEYEAGLPMLDIAAFRERREKSILDGLLFSAASIARSEGSWRYEVDDDAARDIAERLQDLMSVVRALPVVKDRDRAAAVERTRRLMAASTDLAFQRMLQGLAGGES